MLCISYRINPQKENIYILLDGASNHSLCRRSLSNYFAIKGDPTDLTVDLCTGVSTTTTREQKIMLYLSKLDGSFTMPISVTTCKRIGSIPPRRFDPTDYDHMRDIRFTEKYPVKGENSIDILIGEPYYSHLLIGGPILGKFSSWYLPG